MKKIINKAWAVKTELYNWPLFKNLPGFVNSNRINMDKLKPIIPLKNPNKNTINQYLYD